MTIKEMDAVIQQYCDTCKDCNHCLIELQCNSANGMFITNEHECENAYEIIKFFGSKLNDPVNHPSHYTKGKIEVADFIADQKLNFDRGNAVKYVCRAGSKDPEKEIQDLEKAIWYINHEIKMLKGETANGNFD